MRKVLTEQFFNRPTVLVARELLGKYLVRKIGRRKVASMITEVEAYDGFRDRASHASRGKTARNAPMFGPAGYWYVYFTYGMHWMLNIVTREEGYPAAVLIRGVEIAAGPHTKRGLMGAGGEGDPRSGVGTGPARLTKRLWIDKKFDAKPADRKTGLWIEDRGTVLPREVKTGARIGVRYAGPYWSRRRWRFQIKLSPSNPALRTYGARRAPRK